MAASAVTAAIFPSNKNSDNAPYFGILILTSDALPGGQITCKPCVTGGNCQPTTDSTTSQSIGNGTSDLAHSGGSVGKNTTG